VYATVASARRYAEDIIEPARSAGLYLHEVTDEVLDAMADADTPQGVLAVVTDRTASLDDVLAAAPRLLVLLSNVRDPGNLGTVIRAADAMGADAVLVSESSVDVTAPKVVRSTAGSLFHVPIVRGLPVEETLSRLREAGVRTLAADGHGTELLPDVDLTGAHCWVMGNEAWGLPEPLRDACDVVVRVPIHGLAESLNLAMAATICLYASADAHRGSRPHGR
jgi:TrmH family RNA methyltransferase